MRNYVAIPGIPKEEITPEKIIKEVCKYFNVTPLTLKQQNRRRNVASARKVSMYLVRNNFYLALREVGRYFGNRDHTTVIHSINAVREQLESRFDNEYKDCFSWLESKGIHVQPPKMRVVKPKPVKRIKELDDDFDPTPFVRVKGEYSNRSAMGIANAGNN
ncbi:MAG TPA: helix-turn-helix domain-containing protein [Segetibacter sp.]|jgi:hypothetical protein